MLIGIHNTRLNNKELKIGYINHFILALHIFVFKNFDLGRSIPLPPPPRPHLGYGPVLYKSFHLRAVSHCLSMMNTIFFSVGTIGATVGSS